MKNKPKNEPTNKDLEPIINKVFESTIFKYPEPLEKLTDNKAFRVLDKLNKRFENIEKDKKACEGNIWHQLTLNDIETLEYQLNNEKNKVKELESELKKQSQLIKQIQGLASNYFEPKTNPEKHIYNGDLVVSSQYINKILPKINQLIFNESTPEQWRYILDGKTPITEIKVKKNISLRTLKYFFDGLKDKKIIINKYLSKLIQTKRIYYNNQPLGYDKFRNAKIRKNDFPPRLAKDIDSILSLI